MGKVHVFWDNSNIHYAGLNHVMRIFEPDETPELFRTYFRGVLELACRNREIGELYLAGSIPPKSDSLWEYIRSLNVKVETLERTSENKENANDVSIQAAMLRTAVDNIGSKDTIVIVTGDGAGSYLGTGFLADLKRVHEKMGFNIEVISWDICCNGYLRAYAEENGVYVKLEEHYYEVTYIKGKRKAVSVKF